MVTALLGDILLIQPAHRLPGGIRHRDIQLASAHTDIDPQKSLRPLGQQGAGFHRIVYQIPNQHTQVDVRYGERFIKFYLTVYFHLLLLRQG